MFTGIIEEVAEVLEQSTGKLILAKPGKFTDIALGSSVAVSGVCLTVTEHDASSLTFAVIPETLAHTTIGSLRSGDNVNLERALSVSGRFDGHVVQGHVEGVGEVVGVRAAGEDRRITLRVPRPLVPAVAPKGSIALDGVSLTVAALDGDLCTVALIPATLTGTTLGKTERGSLLNIETDIFARTLIAYASTHAGAH